MKLKMELAQQVGELQVVESLVSAVLGSLQAEEDEVHWLCWAVQCVKLHLVVDLNDHHLLDPAI